MRLLNYETKDKAQQAPDRKHLEWRDAFTQAAVDGPGPAIRSEAEAQSARELLELQRTQHETLRVELREIEEAADSTRRMAAMHTGSVAGDHVPGAGYPWLTRERKPLVRQQLALKAALIKDLEIRLEDWISGKPLPPAEPVKVNPAPEGEVSFVDYIAQKHAWQRATRRRA
jgi:hypothetical protein